MRRSERRHLKENAFAVAVVSLQERVQRARRGLLTALVIAAGLVLVAGGYAWWSGRTAAQAGSLLANALVVADAQVVPPPAPASSDAADTATDAQTDFAQPPGTYPSIEAKMGDALPKLLEAADAYPTTPSGITARYRAAAALSALGRHDEAADQYQQVIDQDGASIYTRMATLGLADVQLARGAYAEAITLLESASTDVAGDLPVDGVLMRLGHAYDLAGRAEDARTTYQRVMDEYPFSIYGDNAERKLEALQTEA